MSFFLKFSELFYNAILNFNLTQFIIFSIFCFTFVVCGIIYKLAGNHINHLAMAINDLNTTLVKSSDTLSNDIKDLNRVSRKEHTKMLEVLHRLLGRND